MIAKLFALAPLCLSAQPLIDSIAAVGPNQRDLVDGRPATEAVLGEVHAIALDGSGGLLIGAQRVIVRIDSEGVAHSVAGTGTMGPDGHAGASVPARYTPIAFLRGIAVAPDGSIVFSDTQSVRRLSADGLVTTVLPRNAGYLSPRGVAVDAAGNVYVAVLGHIPTSRFSGLILRIPPREEAAPVEVSAGLNQPEGVSIGPDGNLYVTEYRGDRVLRIADGVVTVAAGAAQGLRGPSGVAVASDGTLYIADTFNNRVRVVAPDGSARTLDGPPLLAPAQIAIDGASGALYVTEYSGHRVWRFAGGVWSVAAGNGERMIWPNDPGDGGPSRIARLTQPEGLAYCAGVVYVADTVAGLIRKITPDDWIDSVARGLRLPNAVACDGSGALYIAERATQPRVSRMDADGNLTTLLSGDLGEPRGLGVDGRGNVYVTDRLRSRVLRIGPSGERDVQWSGVAGVDFPLALAVDLQGRPHFILLREPGGERRVVRLDPDGTLAHVAGTGVCTVPEIRDGTPARLADFCDLFGIAFNEQGVLYLSDQYAVYAIGADGGTRRTAGRRFEPGEIGPIPLGDGGAAMEANLAGPVAIAVGEIGLYAIQSGRVRRVPF